MTGDEETKETQQEVDELSRLRAEIAAERERVSSLKRIRQSLSTLLQSVPKSAYGLFSTFKDIKNPVIYVNEKCHVLWANDSMVALIQRCRKSLDGLEDIIGIHLCEVTRGVGCRNMDKALEERDCPAMQTIVSRQINTNRDGAIPAGCDKIFEICYLPVYNGYSGCFVIYQERGDAQPNGQ